MNDSEKLHNIYSSLIDIKARISVLKCLDIEMTPFPDCAENGSHKMVLSCVSSISSDLLDKIEDIFKVIDL